MHFLTRGIYVPAVPFTGALVSGFSWVTLQYGQWVGCHLEGDWVPHLWVTTQMARSDNGNITKLNKTKQNLYWLSKPQWINKSNHLYLYSYIQLSLDFSFYTYIFYPLLLQPRYQNPSANCMPMIVIPPLLYVNTLSFPMTWIVFQTLR